MINLPAIAEPLRDLPPWTRTWTRAFPLPAPHEEIAALLVNVRETLRPANRPTRAAILCYYLELFDAPKNWDDIASRYLDMLDDLPAWALNEACVAAVKNTKFFPKVAELRTKFLPDVFHAMKRSESLLIDAAEMAQREARRERRAIPAPAPAAPVPADPESPRYRRDIHG